MHGLAACSSPRRRCSIFLPVVLSVLSGCSKSPRNAGRSAPASVAPLFDAAPTVDAASSAQSVREGSESEVLPSAAETLASTTEFTELVTNGTTLYRGDAIGIQARDADRRLDGSVATTRTLSTLKHVGRLAARGEVLFAVIVVQRVSGPSKRDLARHGRSAIVRILPPGRSPPLFTSGDGAFVEDLAVTTTAVVWGESFYSDIDGSQCELRSVGLDGRTPSRGSRAECAFTGGRMLVAQAQTLTRSKEIRLRAWERMPLRVGICPKRRATRARGAF